jgi:hypothetical protein
MLLSPDILAYNLKQVLIIGPKYGKCQLTFAVKAVEKPYSVPVHPYDESNTPPGILNISLTHQPHRSHVI